MFSFQQAIRPIHQVSQLTLEPEHSALTFADFAQWGRRISSLNFADDFDEIRDAQVGRPRYDVGRGHYVWAEAFQRSGNHLKRLVERPDGRPGRAAWYSSRPDRREQQARHTFQNARGICTPYISGSPASLIGSNTNPDFMSTHP
jgi:hypothetical protein